MEYKLAQPSNLGPTSHDPEIIEEVQRLIDSVCARGRTMGVCKRCGSAMLLADATFSLWEGDRSWSVPLPLCPKCDLASEVLNSISRNVA